LPKRLVRMCGPLDKKCPKDLVGGGLLPEGPSTGELGFRRAGENHSAALWRAVCAEPLEAGTGLSRRVGRVFSRFLNSPSEGSRN